MRKVMESIGIFFLALSVLIGCSTQNAKSVETEKTVQYSADRDQRQTEPVVVEKQTTKTEQTAKTEGDTGLLSGTVHVVGQVLALPFRLVGGLIGIVF